VPLWSVLQGPSAASSPRQNGENMHAQNEAEMASIWSEIDHLRHKTVAQLKIRYWEVLRERSRSNHKQFLIRRIAWRLQALAEGDLSERARERALLLAQDADLRLKAPQSSVCQPGTTAADSQQRDSRLPLPGTVLKRKFRDQNITVQVLEQGFEYEGTVYRSLSAVARQISGTQWNGFSFFRLQRVGGSK
jgi:DUF2924 family protein